MEVNKGCIKYQSGPKTVCLWTVTTSLSRKASANHGIARLPEVQRKEFILVLSQTTSPWYYFLVVHVLGSKL
jgi:hypothetical protein